MAFRERKTLKFRDINEGEVYKVGLFPSLYRDYLWYIGNGISTLTCEYHSHSITTRYAIFLENCTATDLLRKTNCVDVVV
jgi:hypothetical protein